MKLILALLSIGLLLSASAQDLSPSSQFKFDGQKISLSQPKWVFGVESQGAISLLYLKLGGSLPVSETQSVYASYGWMYTKIGKVPIAPVPLIDVDDNWFSLKNMVTEHYSLTVGYRWFWSASKISLPQLLIFSPATEYQEKYIAIQLSQQDLRSSMGFDLFNGWLDVDGDDMRVELLTPSIGITTVNRSIKGNVVGNVLRSQSLLFGYNIIKKDNDVLQIPTISIMYNISLFF